MSTPDERLRVCLERTVELEAAHLRVLDWPGFEGPLVHVPDPLAPNDALAEALARELAPRYRVLSLLPRPDSTYQVDAADLLGMLDQFGFRTPVLVGEKLGCLPALLVAAWYPGRVASLVLLEPTYEAPASDSIAARALRDCPPDWPSLRDSVACPVLVLRWDASAVQAIQHFLGL